MKTLVPDRLANLDFEAHNEEVKRLWEDFRAGVPTRAPTVLGTNTRYFLFHPEANVSGVNFRQYTEDANAMFRAQLEFARWSRFNLLQDAELGMPERWAVWPDFQNYYEAAWFGCPLVYLDNEIPDTLPAFEEDPEELLRRGAPDPFGGLMAEGLEFYEQMKRLAERVTFEGLPIDVHPPGAGFGTDGPFTVLCNLVGPTWACEALAEGDPLVYDLLDLITEATIARMQAWRKAFDRPLAGPGMWLADDSIALLSTAMYSEAILPRHRRLYDTFGPPEGRGMHLCGNASRHFPVIVQELGVEAFDTGFPMDFAAVRDALGPNVLLQGGPHVQLVRDGTPDAVYAESRRILASGVRRGGKFVLREGNNLAPGSPLPNTEAMRQASIDAGPYETSP